MGRRDYRQKRPWTMAKETMAQRNDGRRELSKGDYGQMKPEDHDTRRSRVKAKGQGRWETVKGQQWIAAKGKGKGTMERSDEQSKGPMERVGRL